MKKSFRKRNYSNRKYSKKRYKTNKKKNKIKKRGKNTKRTKYTKRRKYTKKTLRLIGGSSIIISPTSAGRRCLSLLDTEHNWIPIKLMIKEITNHSEGDFVRVVITNLNNNETVTIESNEYLIRDKKKEVHETDFRYLNQITIVLNAEQSVAKQYLHKTSVKGYQSKLILGFPPHEGCVPFDEYTKLMESGLLAEGTKIAVAAEEEAARIAAEEEAARIAAASHPTLDVAATAIDFASVVNIYKEFNKQYKKLVKKFPCLVFNMVNKAWGNINLEYLAPTDKNNTFIKMGDWILGSSTINIVKPKNNRSDSEHVNPNFQLRLNLNPQVYGDRDLSECPYLYLSSDTQYSHKLILGWEEETQFINFIQSTGGNLREFGNIESEPETESEQKSPEQGREEWGDFEFVNTEDEGQLVEEDFELVNTVNAFEYIPIYKNTKGGTHVKTNLVIVSDRKDGTLKGVYFSDDVYSQSSPAGSSPENTSLEGWTVELIENENVGVRGGITGVDNPHGLIKLTAPDLQRVTGSFGLLYRGIDRGYYLNPIKLVPRVGDRVGSLAETLKLNRKLEEIIMQYIQQGQKEQQGASVAQPIQSPTSRTTGVSAEVDYSLEEQPGVQKEQQGASVAQPIQSPTSRTTGVSAEVDYSLEEQPGVQKKQSSSTHGHEGLIEEHPLLDLYIKAVTHVIKKFKDADGLNTGGVFRVESDYSKKHTHSFDKYLSGLNSTTLPLFTKYVDDLTEDDPKLLAYLLKRMYRKMPFDIISEKELDILTPGDTGGFYESLGGKDSKRSILLNLLLTLFKEIHYSDYAGEDKMTAKALATSLTTSLKLDVLLQKKLLEMGNTGPISEMNDKMEILILHS